MTEGKVGLRCNDILSETSRTSKLHVLEREICGQRNTRVFLLHSRRFFTGGLVFAISINNVSRVEPPGITSYEKSIDLPVVYSFKRTGNEFPR